MVSRLRYNIYETFSVSIALITTQPNTMISRPTFRRSLGLSLLAATLIYPSPGRADVKMPGIFGDHMVLQQEMKIPVWGWADAGEEVTVTLGTDSAKATADAEGNWRVDLKSLPTETKPLTLTVTGKNSVKFDDVLIGEVWVCSGQSNMEFNTGRAHNAATEVPKATDEQLRLFHVHNKISQVPLKDVEGKWELCSPTSVAGFTAVGYFFGHELRSSLNRPVGLIESSWGGMPAQAYTSLSGLQKDPPFTGYITAFETVVKNTPKAKEEYPKLLAEYNVTLKDWNETVGVAYDATLKKWQADNDKAKAEGRPQLPKPNPTTPKPKGPNPPEGGPSTPTVLYNANIAPLIPYGIRGAIWYQGESNAGNGLEYRTLFPRMISDWREKWNEGDFPFLFVQLANYQAEQVQPAEVSGWALLREAQLMTLSLPNTGMASAVDIGNGKDIHPTNKMDVGLRLAQSAKKVAYKQEVVASGPLYDSMTIEGNKIRLIFKESGSGLQMGVPPWLPDGSTPPAPTELKGFAIAGADKKFVWAKATIDGATVVVTADEVTSPVSVRYDWGNNPAGNLYNKENLPASPFRTDNWVDGPPAPKPAAPPAAPAKP